MKKKMIRFEELDNARKKLGLDERATMNEIKTSYRCLVKKFHPDRSTCQDTKRKEEMQEINHAYHIIMDYCKIYRFSFLKKDFEYNYPELNYQERFKGDWISS